MYFTVISYIYQNLRWNAPKSNTSSGRRVNLYAFDHTWKKGRNLEIKCNFNRLESGMNYTRQFIKLNCLKLSNTTQLIRSKWITCFSTIWKRWALFLNSGDRECDGEGKEISDTGSDLNKKMGTETSFSWLLD